MANTIDDLLAKYQSINNYELNKKKKTETAFRFEGWNGNPDRGSMKLEPYQRDYEEYDPDFNRLTQAGRETQEGIQAEIARREQGAIDLLGQRRDEASTAIDSQLKKLLEESGVQGGLAREQAGASYSGRGLLRSTAASQGIEDITNQELSQKAQYRYDAFGKKQAVNAVVDDSLLQLQQAKEQRRISQTLSSIRQAEEFRSNANLSDIERGYRQSLFDLDLSRQEYEQHTALFSGILGGAAQILAFSL